MLGPDCGRLILSENNKKRLLVFVEPHPLRNSMTEFADAGKLLVSIASAMDEDITDWRVFSNAFVLEELTKLSVHESRLIQPTPAESAFIKAALVEWTPEEIEKRTQFIRGEGEVSAFYEDVLARVRQEYAFDVMLVWSENGAVRQFAKKVGIPVFHMELGPTRAPFEETVYIDPCGTNGSAGFLDLNLSEYPDSDVLPAVTWVGLSAGTEENKPSIMELQAITPTLPFDFMTPYVVVALQLADDLNTIFHSPFRTPKEFLEFLLPKLIGLGYKIVVKGHPGSPARPVNLVAEIEALQYAEEFGNDVVVLDRYLQAKDFIPILSNASAVCSINSSVSFEALLLGVPGLVFGAAVYDLRAMLKKAADDFLADGKWPLTVFEIDRLVTVLCRHIFHPKNPQVMGNVLQKLILNAEGFSVDSSTYFETLSSLASHGHTMIDDEMNKTALKTKVTSLTKTFENLDNTYMGHIDDVTVKQTPHGLNISVNGWAARKATHSPVKIVAICDENRNILCFTHMFDRADVRKAHQHISYPVGFSLATIAPKIVTSDDLVLVLLTDIGAVSCSLSKGGLKDRSKSTPDRATSKQGSLKIAASTLTSLMRLGRAQSEK